MLSVIRMLMAFIDEGNRLKLYLLFVFMLVTAVLEMASIGMILPLLQVVLGGAGGENSLLTRFWTPPEGMDNQRLLFLVTIVFAAFFVVKNIAILAMIHTINRLTLIMRAQFQQRMFSLYLNRPYRFHLLRNTAELIRELTNSIHAAFDGLRLGMNLALEGTLVVAVCILLLIAEPMVTLIISLTMTVAGLLFYRVMAPFFRHWGAQVHKLDAKILKTISQSFGAIKDVKVLHLQPFMNNVFSSQTNDLALFQSRAITALNIPRVFVETMVILGFLGFILLIMEVRGSVEGVITTLGLFGMAALRLMPSMNRILSNSAELKHRAAPVETLYRDLHESLADTDVPKDEHIGPPLALEREIVLQNLCYRYQTAGEGEEEAALIDINLSIAKDESIGIVGSSGAGKTTLIDTIMGLLKPTQGHLLIDGVDAYANLRDWQDHLGYVPQHIHLSDDTMRRNIAFGVEDKDIDEDRLASALSMANLESVVGELPEKLDTVLGENGVRLSGGQRQRIGIARALYRNPEVLVFDEATSALDNETEYEVTRAIEDLTGRKTLIIIAHRLSTVRKCDRLVFMKNARIVATGTYEQLMESNADFRKMAQLGSL